MYTSVKNILVVSPTYITAPDGSGWILPGSPKSRFLKKSSTISIVNKIFLESICLIFNAMTIHEARVDTCKTLGQIYLFKCMQTETAT